MLINPSPLFEEAANARRVEYTGWQPKEARPWLRAVCRHCFPPVAPTYPTVDLRSDRLRCQETCHIWHGSCKQCNTWYWTCDSWVWVSILSDLQVVRAVFEAAPVRHLRYESCDAETIKVEESTTLYFIGGKLEMVK